MGGQWPYLANQRSVLWSRDPLSTNHSSPVLGQLPDEVAPVLTLVPESHAQVDQPDVARLALLRNNAMHSGRRELVIGKIFVALLPNNIL